MGRPYRIAYSSESLSGFKAAISAGLAVGVLARGTVAKTMRVIGTNDGFPGLPSTGLALLEHSVSQSVPVLAMAEAIRRGFSKITEAK